MLNLGVKTKGNSSPRGKAKVYFCAHPKDFVYLSEICADIFKTQDCAVYYKEDPEAAFDGADWLMFDEFSLIVAPITTRFLTENDAPFAREFAFARLAKIPVLPLMQESGLENLFNACEKCKNMQFLDKHKKDATEIPFEEKLQKFLSAVLIGDELAEQIRAEFDGYIFLSYRKKDRQHALDVMRLIHKEDDFRDIAIWYDEYLKPGEDFNDEIADALKKSDLFTLAVTPNLLEKGNYVIESEYPEAKKLGKKILPAELLPTDRYALKRVFDGLDDPTDVRDEKAFYQALSHALEDVEKKENDEDPKHNYLIGLAYFSGVDVETDKPRGFKLIEDCAQAGYAPAMEKLASAYRYGEGVDRDFKKAVAWQSAAVEAHRTAWRLAIDAAASETEKPEWTEALDEVNSAYILATDMLGDYALESGDVETAELAYKEVVDAQEAVFKRFGRFANVYAYFGSLEKLGNGYRWSGKLTLAKQAYEKMIRFIEGLVGKFDDDDLKLSLSEGYQGIGETCLLLGESRETKEYFDKAVQFSEHLNVADSGAAEALATRYASMGASAFEFGEYPVALAYIKKALKLREEIAEQTEEPEDWLRLAEIYVSMAQIYTMTAEREEAEKNLLLAAELFERYAREEGGVWSKGALSTVYSMLGMTRADSGDAMKAREYMEKALALSEQTFEETGLEKFRGETVRALFALGEFHRQKEENDEAKEKFLRMIELIETLPEEIPMTGELKLLSTLVNNSMWMILLLEGDAENAEKYRLAVRRRVDEWDESSFDGITTRDAIGFCTCCNGMAKACMDEGAVQEAEAYYRKSIAAFLKFDEKGGAAALATFAMQAYAGIAWMANLVQDGERAAEYFAKAFALGERVPEPDPIACRFLALAAVGIGDSLKNTDAREAKRYYESALRYCELPAVKEAVQDVASLLSRYLAVVCVSLGETDEAVERLRTVLDEKWGEYSVYDMLLNMSLEDEDDPQAMLEMESVQEFVKKALESISVVADCYILLFSIDPKLLADDREKVETASQTLSSFVEAGVTDETVALYASYLEQILSAI